MESNKVPIDPMSRDYSFSDVVKDERFVQNTKEFWITTIMFCIHAFLLIFNLFVGAPNAANYTYVLGLPMWLFLQLCEFVLYIAACFLVVNRVFKNMEVTPIGNIIPREKQK